MPNLSASAEEKRSLSPAFKRISSTDRSNRGNDPRPPLIDQRTFRHRGRSIFFSAPANDEVSFGKLPDNSTYRKKNYEDNEPRHAPRSRSSSLSKLLPRNTPAPSTPGKHRSRKPTIELDTEQPRKLVMKNMAKFRNERDEYRDEAYNLKKENTSLMQTCLDLKNYQNYIFAEREAATKQAASYLREIDILKAEKAALLKENARIQLHYDSFACDMRTSLQSALNETAEAFIRHKYWYKHGGALTLDDLRSKEYMVEAIKESQTKNMPLSDVLNIKQNSLTSGPVKFKVVIPEDEEEAGLGPVKSKKTRSYDDDE